MKKISVRLIGGFLVILLMIVAVGFYSSLTGQRSLEHSIAQKSEFETNTMLTGINTRVYTRIDRFEQHTQYLLVKESLDRSNRQFDAMSSPQAYMDRMEAEWKVGVLKIIENDLSQNMKYLNFTHYEKKGMALLVSDIIITNRYGATIAATGTAPQYRYDGTKLWRNAKESGSSIGAAEFDKTIGKVIIPIAVPVMDSKDKFDGVILVKLLTDPIFGNLNSENQEHEDSQVRILTLDGKIINSTKAFQFLADASKEDFFKNLKGPSGSFVSLEKGRKTLFTYARSKEALGFIGMPWILISSTDVNEALAESFILRNNILFASLVLLLFGLIIALLISRSITRPVAALQTAVAAITKGNLNLVIESKGNDELSMLARSFAEMQKALQGITVFAQRISSGDLTTQSIKRSEEDTLGITLESMLENLRRQTRDIQEGVGVLAAAASEIFASTTQFAANSSETAAAVSETTTTIEEVKQTAHLSNEKAKRMAETARKTEEIAKMGRESVEETTNMMGRIREQMNTILESIVLLNEQSSAIGEITTTVSNLADQSNLLAVNAAIEAAKAGEQGKGFVVVAQEIRNLAEQSKRATAQVRTILTEVQKATNGAVMATDQGSKAVEQGLKQAGESGNSIASLTETVAEAALGAAMIAASSEQQLVGMDQVAMAMESIQVAIQQGVEGTRQLENGTQNLHGVGLKLKQLVEQVRM
ncbi:MAG: methyl-accepting chemotaxis protein [Treponemataceae bacterium]